MAQSGQAGSLGTALDLGGVSLLVTGDERAFRREWPGVMVARYCDCNHGDGNGNNGLINNSW